MLRHGKERPINEPPFERIHDESLMAAREIVNTALREDRELTNDEDESFQGLMDNVKSIRGFRTFAAAAKIGSNAFSCR